MKYSIFMVLTIAAVPVVTLPILGTQTYAATRRGFTGGATPTAAQKAVKAKDSQQVQRAKAAQRARSTKA